VTEKKIISLDLGSNLTRYEEHLSAAQPLPNCTIGLTLHEPTGEVQADRPAGWCRHWEKIDDAYLGTGVVVAPSYVLDYQDYRSAEKDHSQLYLVAKPQQSSTSALAGKKAGSLPRLPPGTPTWPALPSAWPRR
jgi:hypothetical protein